MKAKTAIDQITRVSAYISQCRVRALHEDEDTHIPPTAEETISLIQYLKGEGARPLVIGSIGVLSYLKNIHPKRGFRPTVDLDLWVNHMPPPPPGWSVDPESIGVTSWISPSGGYVDFLRPNQDLASGIRTPPRLDADPETEGTEMPVASWTGLLKLKLNSDREKDLADAIALVRSQGRMPSDKELGRLSHIQKDNYQLVQQWFEIRPHGEYGE